MKKIQISPELYRKIEKRIRGTEFKSVSEYITFVLEEIVKEEEDEERLTEEDEEKIKKRLQKLGYL